MNSNIQSVKNDQPQSDSQDQLNNSQGKKNKDFVCPCGRSYGSYPAVYAHIKRKHDGIPPGQIIRPKSIRKRGRPFKSLTSLQPNQKRDDIYKKYQKKSERQGTLPNSYYPFQSHLKQQKQFYPTQSLHQIQKRYYDLKRSLTSQSRPFEYPSYDDFYHRGQIDQYYRGFPANHFSSQYFPPLPNYSLFPQYREEFGQLREKQQKLKEVNENSQRAEISQLLLNNNEGDNQFQKHFHNQENLLNNQSGKAIQEKLGSKDHILNDFNPEEYQYVNVMIPLGDDKFQEVKILQKKKNVQQSQKPSISNNFTNYSQKNYNQMQVNSSNQVFPFMSIPSKQASQIKVQVNLQLLQKQLQQKFIPIQNGIMNFLQPILQEDANHVKAHDQNKSSQQNQSSSESNKNMLFFKKDQPEAIKFNKKSTIKQILNEEMFKSIYQQIKRNRNSQDQQNFIQTSFITVLNEFLKYLDSFLESEQYAQVKMFVILFYHFVFDQAHVLITQSWPKAYQMAQFFTKFLQEYLPQRIQKDLTCLSKYFLFKNVDYCGSAMLMWLSNWLAIKQYVSNKLNRGYTQNQFFKQNQQNKTYQENYNTYVSAVLQQIQQKPKKKKTPIQLNSQQKNYALNDSINDSDENNESIQNLQEPKSKTLQGVIPQSPQQEIIKQSEKKQQQNDKPIELNDNKSGDI